jgi:DNA-binding response OmpR family regulator
MAKILVVEDDEIIQKIMQVRLRSLGHDVLIAHDGAEGVTLAQSEMPDIILMDLWLPVLDGWEATRQIKAVMDVPVIALTGAATVEEKQKMSDVGCIGYALKPVNFAELIAQINALLHS